MLRRHLSVKCRVMAHVFSDSVTLQTNLDCQADYDDAARNHPKALSASRAILPFYITACLEFDRIVESSFQSTVLCTEAGGETHCKYLVGYSLKHNRLLSLMMM